MNIRRTNYHTDRVPRRENRWQPASEGAVDGVGDLLIGTTALELGYMVVTHNVRHFQMIPDLVVKFL